MGIFNMYFWWVLLWGLLVVMIYRYFWWAHLVNPLWWVLFGGSFLVGPFWWIHFVDLFGGSFWFDLFCGLFIGSFSRYF